MMNFKDSLADDIDKVFFDNNEFAETVIINSEEMTIVRDDDSINPSITNKQLATYDVLFHVASSYFVDGLPQSGMLMEFEGEEHRIKKVNNNLGVLTIGLSRVDS